MVLVGGLGRLVGTVFGVIFVTLVPVLLDLGVSFLCRVYDAYVTIFLGPVKELVFGGLIILFIIFEPEGLEILTPVLLSGDCWKSQVAVSA